MSKIALWSAGVFLTLLLAAPSVAAVEATSIVATSGAPVKFQGDTSFRAREATLVVRGDAAPTALSLIAQGGLIERVRVTSAYATAAGTGLLGEQRVTVDELPLPAGAITIGAARDDALLLAEGTGLELVAHQTVGAPERVWTDASAQLNVLVADERFSAALPAVKLAQVGVPASRDAVELPAGTYQAAVRSGGARLTEVSRLIAAGVTLTDASGAPHEGQSTTAQVPGGLYVPGPAGGSWMGPGTHTEETLTYFVVKPGAGSLSLAAPRILAYTSDLWIQHTGSLGLPWAEGRLDGPNESALLSGEQVLMGGSFRLRPVGASVSDVPSITLLGEGRLDFLRIGALQRAWGRDDVALATGGAVATVGLVAILAYFWPLLKYGASLGLFPLYARVPKEQTLEHKGRELLYDLIRNEPGVSTNKLAKDVPFGWSTLTYHLRVLERNEAIVSVRDGRYKRFFDRQSGRFANGRKYVLAVLKNDATYGIAQFIREKPGSSQKEVAGSFRLSPSSVHWHVERLSEVGLVSKLREAHNVKYFPGEGWDHVSIEDLKGLMPRASPADAGVAAPTPAATTPPAP